MPSRHPKPVVFQFEDHLRTRFADRRWHCPIRLVKELAWSELWRDEGTVRGGGTVSAVLAVLAVHTWPGKAPEAPRPSGGTLRAFVGAEPPGTPVAAPAAPSDWTPWQTLGHRRIARLAGVNKDTVRRVLDRLRDLRWSDDQRVPDHTPHGGDERQQYRLRTALYGRGGAGDPYAVVPAHLFYGGTWFMIPTHAARHLYVTLACLDPLPNEDEALKQKHQGEAHESDEQYLDRRRARERYSLEDLADLSGLDRKTLREALGILTRPIFCSGDTKRDDIPLIRSGTGRKGNASHLPRWYAPHRDAPHYNFDVDDLNASNSEVRGYQEHTWPEWAAARRQAKEAARKRALAARLREASLAQCG
jgi:hypothetical protein